MAVTCFITLSLCFLKVITFICGAMLLFNILPFQLTTPAVCSWTNECVVRSVVISIISLQCYITGVKLFLVHHTGSPRIERRRGLARKFPSARPRGKALLGMLFATPEIQ